MAQCVSCKGLGEVARQYWGRRGSRRSCLLAVSLQLGTDTEFLPVTLGLYLPKAWSDDPEHRAAARVLDTIRYQTKMRRP